MTPPTPLNRAAGAMADRPTRAAAQCPGAAHRTGPARPVDGPTVRPSDERPRLRAPWACLPALVLVVLPAFQLTAQDGGRQLNAGPSPMSRMLAELPRMPPDRATEFVAHVLEHVAAAYEAELERALTEAREDPGSRDRRMSWVHATTPVLERLREAKARLPDAGEVDLLMDRQDQMLLMVDDEPLFLSWPRPATQARLERELVSRFCERHACPDDADTLTGAGPGAGPEPTGGTWTLSQLHPPAWESDGGLRCEFRDYADRAEKEARCRGLIGELQRVDAALRDAERQGHRIDRQAVTVAGEHPDGLQRLVVNEAGDHLALELPLLAANPVSWPEARRWLQARAENRATVATVLRAPLPTGR